MQSDSVLPPPPGMLGAAWLGLAFAVEGSAPGVAPVSVLDDPPPPGGGVVSVGGGDKGGAAGVPIDDEEGGVVACGVGDVEPGAVTGGGDNGATGAT